MPRKEFTDTVKQNVLVKSARHCCVCEKFCATKIEVHHIDGPEDNSEDNALPVCFDCHAEIKQYNPAHPKGTKFTPGELRRHRERVFARFAVPQARNLGTSDQDFGRGFRAGAEWAEDAQILSDLWRTVSIHGDFAIEIFQMFGTEDTYPATSETYYSDVETGTTESQMEGHNRAFSTAMMFGFVGMDGNAEELFLTSRGKKCRELLKTVHELFDRYKKLEWFWNTFEQTGQRVKPVPDPPIFSLLPDMAANPYRLVRFHNRRERLYVIMYLDDTCLIVLNIDTGHTEDINTETIEFVETFAEIGEYLVWFKD